VRRVLLLSLIAACGGGSESDRPLPGFRAVGAPAAAAGTRVTFRLERQVAHRDLQLALLGDDGTYLVPVEDATYDGDEVTVTVEKPATYQLVVAESPVPPKSYVWRAIAGVSMGGGAAAGIGLRAPDRWDLVIDLGGEPGPLTLYSANMLASFMLSVSAARLPYPGTFEALSDFEHFLYQSGSGVGLTLSRATYMRATRDLLRALGNPVLYDAANAYLPPGIAAAPDCSQVLHGFHDRRFNPDGSLPVITVCDGGDSTRLGLGVYDPSLPQTNPWQVLLAVDRNGNGVRDEGEPIIVQAAEPWKDVGSDGVADEDEPGYDPIANPDPNGDDYHPTRNPGGTEKNGWRDDGEPFEDVGLDGVAGTCQQPAAGCYDFGEGDGKWTVNPSFLRWLANDAGRNLAALDAPARARLAVYADAGIRDFLNSEVSTAGLAAEMARQGFPVASWNGFPRLGGVPSDIAFDASMVVWSEMPANVFVRYGDPDATPDAIAAGDGRHVGTTAQVLDRVLAAFFWADARWPGGDYTGGGAALPVTDQHLTSPTTGRDLPYAVVLPPGYSDGGAGRFPCVFFLHGYGQKPDDLAPASFLLGTYMTRGLLQKMIVVFPDGRCRDGDGCETGTFFADSPVSAQAQMETHLYELRAEIESKYRCK